MREVFYEETARNLNEKSSNKKYVTFNIISKICWGLVIFWLIIFIFFVEVLVGNVFLNIVIGLLPSIAFGVSAWLLGRMKNKYAVDYDYTFISGEIRISKVIKQSKRRKVITFSTSAIETLGKYGSDTCKGYLATKGIKQYFLTSNPEPDEGKEFYYLVVNQGEKKLLVLECSQLFMINVLKFANRTILEKDFK